MKKTALLIFAILVFGLTVYLNLDHFHAKFYNRTGEDIDSLMIGKKLIGHIDRDSTTEFISFSNFKFNDGYPDEEARGIIKLKRMKPFIRRSFCGNGGSIETKGFFVFDIRNKEDEKGNSYLFILRHNSDCYDCN